MKSCDWCGRENGDENAFCAGCGKSLEVEPSSSVPFPTPSRLHGQVQEKIWDYFAVKRGRFYTAGLLIGLLAAGIGFVTGRTRGMTAVIVAIAVGGAGMAAAFFLRLMERLNARIEQSRIEGNPTWGMKLLGVIVGLVVLIALAVLIVGICGIFIL